MDAPDVDERELERSLTDLRRINLWLGGRRTALSLVMPFLRGGARSVLDVATGSADVPLALARRARREGLRLRVVATDVHASTLRLAREHVAGEPGVETALADALCLPYADGTFDVAMMNMALHHFDEEHAVRALRELRRVAHRAVVVTDLVRSRPALLGARLLSLTVWLAHPVTRHDGPNSVRAAFTAAELRGRARRAGLERARVRSHPGFRISLVAEAG
jgi:ubiquinone/menaquinone biosynthesis C-methylase UbiE